MRILRNKKGSSLPAVFLVTATLIVIVAALASSVSQWSRIVKGEEITEYAYIAAESAIERSFQNLDDVITKPDFASKYGIAYSSGHEVDFAKDVVKQINVLANKRPKGDIYRGFNDIDVAGDNMPKASAKLEFSYIASPPAVLASGGESVIMTIGVTSKASLKVGIHNSSDKEVFAKRLFTVPVSKHFKLNAAIYSIGDLIAQNTNATIKGDVYVFGTSAKNQKEPKQWYYGGIYAKTNGNLKIDGNAFTNSFIRAGKYKDYDANKLKEDKSTIRVTKDAVAQCIQIFGNLDKIVVYRNAYTFDDLEVDGPNSIAAINGSFLGLSSGADTHDSSSCILNAAPVHYGYSQDSMKSRIVVNQDVMINGAAFKLKDADTGETDYQLESASMGWEKDSGGIGYPIYKGGSIKNDVDFKNRLEADYNAKIGLGFLNLFQVWDKVNVVQKPDGTTDDASIDGWLANINSAIGNEGNTLPRKPKKISGYFPGVLAANDALYFNTDNYDHKEKMQFLNNKVDKNFENDFELDATEKKFGANFWDDACSLNDSDYWQDIGSQGPRGCLDTLQGYLSGFISQFATRTLYGKDSKTGVALTAVKNEYVPQGTYKSRFMYMLNELLKNYKGKSHVIYGDDINDELSKYIKDNPTLGTPSDYYLVVNDNPSKDINVSGTFNGIIFTVGRVKINSGAYITGSIIAAGRDKDRFGDYKTIADDIDGGCGLRVVYDKTITGGTVIDTQTDFENGEYAGVIFEGGGSNVYFPGSDQLSANMKKWIFDLDDIFFK